MKKTIGRFELFAIVLVYTMVMFVTSLVLYADETTEKRVSTTSSSHKSDTKTTLDTNTLVPVNSEQFIIEGTVRDISGRPLEGAVVSVRYLGNQRARSTTSPETQTDQNGRYRLSFDSKIFTPGAINVISHPTFINPEIFYLKLEVKKEGYVWNDIIDSQGKHYSGLAVNTNIIFDGHYFYCLRPEPVRLDLVRLQKNAIKPEYAIFPGKVKEWNPVLRESVHFDVVVYDDPKYPKKMLPVTNVNASLYKNHFPRHLSSGKTIEEPESWRFQLDVAPTKMKVYFQPPRPDWIDKDELLTVLATTKPFDLPVAGKYNVVLRWKTIITDGDKIRRLVMESLEPVNGGKVIINNNVVELSKEEIKKIHENDSPLQIAKPLTQKEKEELERLILVSPELEKRGRDVLVKMKDANEYWFKWYPKDLPEFSYTFHHGEMFDIKKRDKEFTWEIIKGGQSWYAEFYRKGISYIGVSRLLCIDPEKVRFTLVKEDKEKQTIQLDFILPDQGWMNAFGRGIEETWRGWINGGVKEGSAIIDLKTFTPVSIMVFDQNYMEHYSDYVEIKPEKRVPQRILIDVFSEEVQVDFRFKVYKPCLWLFDQTWDEGKKCVWVDNVKIEGKPAEEFHKEKMKTK